MKGFMAICRAATCASGVIPECFSRGSVVAKRRDSVQKPYGMTSGWGGRTANTSILSFQGPHTSGNLESRNKMRIFSNKQTGSRIHVRDDNYNGNDRSRITTLWDDDYMKKEGHPKRAARRVSGSTSWVVSRGFTLIELLVVVLIIGILASVALPQYQRAVHKTRLTNALQIAFNLRKAQEVYYLANGTYTGDWYSLDIDYSKSGCGINSFDTSLLSCKNTIFDNIVGSVGPASAHQVKIYYDIFESGWPPKGIAELSVYFEHSSKPNQIECTGKTDEGIALCKSLNL